MELPEIGIQCATDSCNQLDFLPLKCKCGKQFCTEHFHKHATTCETFIQLQLDSTQLKTIQDLHRCSRPGCPAKSLVPLLCPRCNQHFCVQHRHLAECHDKDAQALAKEKERYAAPVRKFNEAKVAVDQQIERSLAKARKTGRNPALANKVQLMKIKGKAKGLQSIAPGDRVYFNAMQPHKEGGTPVFVSKTWSIGRVIDAVAQECDLKNENNVSSATKRLRLFKVSGEIITKNPSDLLQGLLDAHALADGENLVIAYVAADCQFHLN